MIDNDTEFVRIQGIIAESQIALLLEEVSTLKAHISLLEEELKSLKKCEKYDSG